MGKMKPKSTSPENFPQQFWDKLTPNWRDAAEAKKDDDLKIDMFTSEKAIAQTEQDMEDDSQLADAKENVKALSEGYREVLAEEKAKIRYALYLLNKRGVK